MIPEIFDILTASLNSPLDEFNRKILRGAHVAIKAEIAELRRLKLPIIRSVDGKPFDFNPDTNPDAPPWIETEVKPTS